MNIISEIIKMQNRSELWHYLFGDLMKARDTSKLVKKVIINRNGHKQTVYVKATRENKYARLNQLKDKYRSKEKQELPKKLNWVQESEKILTELKSNSNKIKDAENDIIQLWKPFITGAKDSFGRQMSPYHEIEENEKYSSYLENAKNYGVPDKKEIESEINTLSKRKKISAKNKEKLKLLKEAFNNYENIISERKKMVQIYKETKKKKDSIKEFKKQDGIIIDKLNSIYKNLGSDERQKMEEMKKRIYG